VAIFKRSSKPSYSPVSSYSPLEVPRYGTFTSPDLATLSGDRQMVQSLMDAAAANTKGLSDGRLAQPALLSRLNERLIPAILEGSGARSNDDVVNAMKLLTACGFVVGHMENEGGGARSKQVESHYWNAMVMLGLQMMGATPSDLGPELNFAMFAAYYVAREGEAGVDEVLAAAIAR